MNYLVFIETTIFSSIRRELIPPAGEIHYG